MIKFLDEWRPNKPPSDVSRRLVSKDINPKIELKIVKDGIEAKVIFPFFDVARSDDVAGSFNEGWSFSEKHAGKALYRRIIQGSSQEVYARAARVASKIGLSDERSFNYRWNRTLINLLNKPSEGKSMLNLGTYKPKDKSAAQFGLYDIKTPAELLSQKLIASKLPGATFAERSGVDEASLYRHLSGTAISREAAVKYAKVLGCDPSELLFNPLLVPIWARVDTQEIKSINKLSVYAGELRPNTKNEYALCPREVYRPDVKCLVVDQTNSVYHNNHFFYYHSTEVKDLENQLVVVGTPIKNFNDKEVRYRYFVGIYKASAVGKGAFSIVSIDPYVEYGPSDPDDNPGEYADYLRDILENNYVIDDIKPTENTFVAPIVSIINPARIAKSQLRSDIIKDHEKFYAQARMSDQMNILKYKELLHQERLKAEKQIEKTQKKLVEKTAAGYAKKIRAQSHEYKENIKELLKKFEQQQMLQARFAESRSKGGNPFLNAWSTFSHKLDEKKASEKELENIMMEQQKAIEKLKEAVSVPELFEEDKDDYYKFGVDKDEDKVA